MQSGLTLFFQIATIFLALALLCIGAWVPVQAILMYLDGVTTAMGSLGASFSEVKPLVVWSAALLVAAAVGWFFSSFWDDMSRRNHK